jgi:hypothetical protein
VQGEEVEQVHGQLPGGDLDLAAPQRLVELVDGADRVAGRLQRGDDRLEVGRLRVEQDVDQRRQRAQRGVDVGQRQAGDRVDVPAELLEQQPPGARPVGGGDQRLEQQLDLVEDGLEGVLGLDRHQGPVVRSGIS